ncbi:MOSC domain-containing protein [Labrenzia sp. PHM005]|uniref:MOSC domain-containing protein n=1 Tax=Labrenzia sp. PHM005 TaxID=2590016 RepID=UPI00143D257A|nr:MOSC domain-containing protein [Labrenzia sp. PHM005]
MRIRSLWRYPVKSLQGEQVDLVYAEERGFQGDRLFALADQHGKLGSGKSTNRFQRIGNLLALRAEIKDGTTYIGTPGDQLEHIQSDGLDQRLSKVLDQPVEIVREQNSPHFDDAAVHIILSSELDKLQALLPEAEIDTRRFRANIVLDVPDHMTSEDLLGSVLSIGDARLKVTHKTERCVMVTAGQDTLPKDPQILKAISRSFDLNFGVYASVLRPGTVEAGQLVGISYPAKDPAHRRDTDLGF